MSHATTTDGGEARCTPAPESWRPYAADELLRERIFPPRVIELFTRLGLALYVRQCPSGNRYRVEPESAAPPQSSREGSAAAAAAAFDAIFKFWDEVELAHDALLEHVIDSRRRGAAGVEVDHA